MAGRPPSPPGIRPENSADGNSPLHPVQQAALQRQHELSQQAALLHQENVNLKAALPPGDRPLPVSGPLRPDVAEVLKTPELQANVERLKVGNQSLEEERARRDEDGFDPIGVQREEHSMSPLAEPVTIKMAQSTLRHAFNNRD